MSAKTTIGVDLGGTKMLVGVLAADDRIARSNSVPSHGLTQEQLIDGLVRELEAAIAEHPDVAAIGLGIPCTIDRGAGLCVSAVNLPLRDLPVRDLLADQLGLPVSLDNDANVAAIAESQLGAGRDASDMVLLTIGTGIGGGLILGGEPYRGSTGAGAELGHVVVDIDGPKCQGNCPNHGCIEAIASGTALGREARLAAAEHPESALGEASAQGEEVDGRLVTELALAGDPLAVEVVARIGRRLGAALSGLANIFDPDVIVIGGGVMAAGDLLLEPAREEFAARALRPQNATPIKPAALGPEAGMIGAALLARDELAAAAPAGSSG